MKPTRPTKPRKPTKPAKTTAQVEETKDTPEVTDEAVDKDAIITALQAEVATAEQQSQKIAELQEALKNAEASAGSSAAVGSEEFKRQPDKDDDEKYFYFEIIWHPKRSDSDEEDVTLGVNGKMMVWPRDKVTVIRSDYLEVADNAFVPKFKQLPGEDRKEIGGLKPYTYTINKKITEEEYVTRKKAGDQALRDDLQSKGMSR